MKTTIEELRQIRLSLDRAIDGNKTEIHRMKIMMRTRRDPSKAAMRGASNIIDAIIRYEDHVKRKNDD